MTSEELEAEREQQRANGEVPKYAGAHSNLTDEQIAAFRAEGRKPSIRMRVPENHTHTFPDIVRGDISFASSDLDRKSTRLNSSHVAISYAVFCLKKKS